MNYREIDMEQYKRTGQFDYFQSMSYPYAGMTVQMDITQLMADRKRNGYPFFLTMLYAVVSAANAIPEFRQRIRNGKIIEYDFCIPSYTLALSEGNYCYCKADGNLAFPDFLKDAAEKQEMAKESALLHDGGDFEQLYFVSSIPWVNYTSIIQPVPCPADSNPRITWGKYENINDKIVLSVSVLVNHALMDGYQISQFFRQLQLKLDNTAWMTTDEQ